MNAIEFLINVPIQECNAKRMSKQKKSIIRAWCLHSRAIMKDGLHKLSRWSGFKLALLLLTMDWSDASSGIK